MSWLLSAIMTVLTYATGIARLVLGGWLLLIPGLRSGGAGVLVRIGVFIAVYLAFWGGIWWLQWRGLAGWWEGSATWFVESRTGMETALQVLPATIVALLVFVLGAIFVVAQLAITAYGQRAAVLLGLDEDIQTAVVRPLLLAAAALLLAGQVPDVGTPTPIATAAVATCVLATIALFFRAALVLVGLLGRYTGPRSFSQYAVEPVYNELADGATGLVVLRGPLLGEALKAALRRGDSVAVQATLEAIMDMQAAYLSAVQVRPNVRRHSVEDGSRRDNWLAEDLTHALVGAGEDALKILAPPTTPTASAEHSQTLLTPS